LDVFLLYALHGGCKLITVGLTAYQAYELGWLNLLLITDSCNDYTSALQALRNLAANIQFIELVSDMWARLDGLIHAAKHPDPAHPITERRKMLLQRFATRGWLHAALVLCGLVKVTSFFFAMALLYLMLTSEQQPILTVVPKIVDVLKGEWTLS
jgi:hypothetical protein